jgi:outer membrane protein assembly factor BamB
MLRIRTARHRDLAAALRVVGIALFALAGAPGCSSSKDDKADQPAELVDFKPTARIREDWDAGLGAGDEFLRLGLPPASDGSRIFTVDHDGRIEAFDAARGKRAWRTDSELPLAGGPGVGEGHVLAGSSDGYVVSLRAADGTQEWRVSVGSEVLAPPAVGAQRAFVRTVDGKLIALDLSDGRQAWFAQQTMPRLSVRGTASPVVDRNMVVCGFDNGRVAAYDVNDGSVIWDVLVAPPSGRTEVDRMSDINATVRVIGDEIYAVGYQGRLVAMARESGQILWSVEFSSYSGLGADLNNIYVAGGTGEILAVERASGRELWRQDQLRNRDLTAPTPYGSFVVVGDLEGYVHFFDAASGEIRARVQADSSRINSAPLVVSNRLYVTTDGGEIVALRDATQPQEK